MRRGRQRESFWEWALKGLIRGLIGIVVAVIAAYFVYRVVIAAFTEAARQSGHL